MTRSRVALILWAALVAACTAWPARAFEGMTTGPEHARIKDVIQRGYGFEPELKTALATLSRMVDLAEKQFGKNSRQVGVLLTDIGETAFAQAKSLQGEQQADKLRRAVKALETGAEMLKPYEAESDGYIFSRARAYRLAGEAHLQLGQKKAAETALRTGLSVHWKRFDDNYYQLRFFPTLFDAIADPAEKLKVAQTEAKIARKVHNQPAGSDHVDVAAAERRMRLAESLGNPLSGRFDEIRRKASELAAAGQPDLSLGELEKGLQLAGNDRERELFIARIKPEPFFIYADPDAPIRADWGGMPEGFELSAYDHIATKFLVDRNLAPYASESRNNLTTLLGLLVGIYGKGDKEKARYFCRLLPAYYSGYDAIEPGEKGVLPSFCAHTIRWAKWMRLQGNNSAGIDYLRIGLDLLPPADRQSPEQKQFRVSSLREEAVFEAYYGSPDSFLSVFERLAEVDDDIPADLLFYDSVIRDNADGLQRDGAPLFSPEALTAYQEASAPGPESKLAFVGPKLGRAICERGSLNVSAFTRAAFCVSEGITDVMSAEEIRTVAMNVGEEATGKMRTAANWRVLALAEHPDLAEAKQALEARFGPGETDSFKARPLSAKERKFLARPRTYEEQMKSAPDYLHDTDFDAVLVVDALLAGGKGEIARTWLDAAIEQHRSASPPQTIFSLWLAEEYEEQTFQDGWRWLILGRPLLAERVFSRHIPDSKAGFLRTVDGYQLDLASLSWERTLGAFHGRMLARERLGQRDDARADARILADYMRFLLGLQSFSRNETRELIVRVARPTLRKALDILTESEGLSAGDIDAAARIAQMMRPSGTGATLARLSARLATVEPELAALAKNREELRQRWLSLPEDQADQRRVLAGQLDALDRQLQAAFPRYVELAGTIDVSVGDVAKRLSADEAVLVYFDSGHDMLAATITAQGADLRRIGPTAAVADLAKDIRRGLELRGGRLPAFRANASHRLYQLAVEPLQALWPKDIARVTVIADGALQSVPFSVLLMQPADEDRFSTAEWFGDRFAVSAMPTLASFVTMRDAEAPAAPGRSFLGVGNPKLDGEPNRNRGVLVSDIVSARGATDVDAIRSLPRLPETADELKALQGILRAGSDALRLGDDASETFVKTAALGDIGIIAFATHGLLAGEVSGVEEPGLVLTPPERASAADDGYLAASEVAGLNLSADLVLLSACNTAGPAQLGAEGLSGLARAFFFAGARTLIVSHWSVDSAATAQLMTSLFGIREQDREKSYATALKEAMRKLRSLDGGKYAHPLFWGGFEVVGAK